MLERVININFIDGETIGYREVEELRLDKIKTKELKNIMLKVFNVLNAIQELDDEYVNTILECYNINDMILLKHFLKIGLDIE
jgi:hypothetical protein